MHISLCDCTCHNSVVIKAQALKLPNIIFYGIHLLALRYHLEYFSTSKKNISISMNISFNDTPRRKKKEPRCCVFFLFFWNDSNMPFIWLLFFSHLQIANPRSCTHTYPYKMHATNNVEILLFVLCAGNVQFEVACNSFRVHMHEKKKKIFCCSCSIHYHSWFAINSLLVMMIHKMSISVCCFMCANIFIHFIIFFCSLFFGPYVLSGSVCWHDSRANCVIK